MEEFEEGIQKYLARIKEETGNLPPPRTQEEKRDYIEKRHAVWKRPAPEHIAIRDWWVAMPGREIPVRMYRRRDVTNPPVIVYLHGGGFTNSSYDTHDTITWGIAEGTGALVISVNYRRSPENPYPAATDDGFAILGWIEKNAEWLEADAGRIAIVGDSAGGTLTAALSIIARDRAGPAIRQQCILYGSLDTNFDRDSLLADKDPMLRREQSIMFWTQYLSGNLKTRDPFAVPMRVQNMAGLPPALVTVGEFDPLHDACKEYADRLDKAGVPTEFRRVKGAIHGFYRARFVSEIAAQEFDYLCEKLRKALA